VINETNEAKMTRRIEEDLSDFQDVYAGRRRKALRKYINAGQFPKIGPNGKGVIRVPKIDIPHITFGEPNSGVGRGGGKPGDVIDQKKKKGKGEGGAGDGEAEGIEVAVDMEEIWQAMDAELALPRMKPKNSQIYEDIIIKYNNISLVGPESLRHNRRTLMQAMKRMCATGEIDKLHHIPGFNQPIKLITPINSDKRYRQYTEIKIPSNKAVIFFARDGSASMTQDKCDIVSEMAWWIDAWIKRFYDKVDRCYIWHDAVAQEVDEKKFYRYRDGGGTTCSSAIKLIADQLETRYPPDKWNIYVFYFTDGENQGSDNPVFADLIKNQLPPNKVNLIGLTEVFAMKWGGMQNLKEYVDEKLAGVPNLKTTEIKSNVDRGGAFKNAIVDLLGAVGAQT
jgi:uncharacterized sporulation protein YeaH/YhbH (DUF444 family)